MVIKVWGLKLKYGSVEKSWSLMNRLHMEEVISRSRYVMSVDTVDMTSVMLSRLSPLRAGVNQSTHTQYNMKN